MSSTIFGKSQGKFDKNNKKWYNLFNLVELDIKGGGDFIKNSYVIEYLNENEFRKKERAVKKYNMLAYKKLMFDYYPSLRDGNFIGKVVSKNTKDNIEKYELKLPTDTMFSKVHGDIILHYSVYKGQNIVMLETISPEEILNEGHQKELSTYKGVMVSKSHADKDMFKINLLNMIGKE